VGMPKTPKTKRYFVKHEDLYLVNYVPLPPKDFVGSTSEWSKQVPLYHFKTLKEASTAARNLRKGPRQFAGLGKKSRVVSRPA